jgi:hypothetical protein
MRWAFKVEAGWGAVCLWHFTLAFYLESPLSQRRPDEKRQQFSFTKMRKLYSGKRGGMFPGHGPGANNQGICFI